MSAAKRFSALDSLRGISAILVLCLHIRVLNSITETTFIRNAFYFVEFFFVLSGFVMYYTYSQKPFNKLRFRNYLIGRFFRLYPLHFVMLVVTVLIEFFKLYIASKGYDVQTPGFIDKADPAYLIPTVLLLQGWMNNVPSGAFNIVAWSLSIEFYVNVFMGLLLFKSTSTRTIIFMLLTAIPVALLCTGNHLLKNEVYRGVAYFFAGCMTYQVYARTQHLKRNPTLFSIIEICLVLAMYFMVTYLPENNFKSPILAMLFALSVWTFAGETGIISRLLNIKPLLTAGKLSFSIYLIHIKLWFCFTALTLIIARITHFNITANMVINKELVRIIPTSNMLTGNLALLLFVLFTAAVASFTYKVVEVRWIEKGKRFRIKEPAPAPQPVTTT
ncbi:acyltransferase [Chitinophaga sp. Cy-1792]|uniref:acyltransferase family protein n=1 Tax=Chitinophaga sp. Cy-1792 TaxID=2608339 RepID=UPI0014221D18|nr:acyltransferase [Chitinophaga sp. Cy-1792]NIG52103.1 acyltransferase [Chitinophaga sp. Cy-1792]